MTMPGLELRRRRESLGLTQAELAELLGTSRIWLALQERSDAAIERRTELAFLYTCACLSGALGPERLPKASSAAGVHRA